MKYILKKIFQYVLRTTIIQRLIRFFDPSNHLINFNKIKFWNYFLSISFICLLWLCFISLIATNILEKSLDPTSSASNSSVIIEIYPENNLQDTENKVALVKKILQSYPQVKKYKLISNEDINKIITNFTNNSNLVDSKSLPKIITVEVDDTDYTIVQELKITLSKTVSNVFVDTEAEILKRLSNPIEAAQYISIIIPIIALAVLGLILFLIIYAILFSNRNTFTTLLILGTPVNTISREFASWIFLKTIKASFICTILNFTTIIVCVFVLHLSDIIQLGTYFILLISTIIFIPILSTLLGRVFVNKIIKNNFQ